MNMNQNNINQDYLNRQDYLKNIRAKRDISTCLILCISYIAFFVFIVITLGLFIWLSTQEEFIENPNILLSADSVEVIIYPIIDFIFLEIVSAFLLFKTKKIKEGYPEEMKKLWIWYLLGLFLLIPSFVASIITINKCKKITKEINEKLNSPKYI